MQMERVPAAGMSAKMRPSPAAQNPGQMMKAPITTCQRPVGAVQYVLGFAARWMIPKSGDPMWRPKTPDVYSHITRDAARSKHGPAKAINFPTSHDLEQVRKNQDTPHHKAMKRSLTLHGFAVTKKTQCAHSLKPTSKNQSATD